MGWRGCPPSDIFMSSPVKKEKITTRGNEERKGLSGIVSQVSLQKRSINGLLSQGGKIVEGSIIKTGGESLERLGT